MTKPVLTILRGVSGSGKSTLAESIPGAMVVSRDRLRVAMFGDDGEEYYKVPKEVLRAREDAITEAEHAAIRAGLRGGMNVISDNTNVKMRYVQPIANIGYREGAEVKINVVDVPLDVAIKRNAARAALGGRFVPEKVIREQYGALQQSKKHLPNPPQVPDAYNGTPGKPKAFLVDIDGTLAHMRDHRGPFDWKSVGLDDVDEVIAEIVRMLMINDEPYNIIVMSGRDEVCRPETEAWLADYAIPYDDLFMRPEGDMRKDNIVKAELFDKYVRDNYDVRFVLDDRQQVVDMWRDMGITCLQVAPGDF